MYATSINFYVICEGLSQLRAVVFVFVSNWTWTTSNGKKDDKILRTFWFRGVYGRINVEAENSSFV